MVVDLNALLDKTVERFLLLLKQEFEELSEEQSSNVVFFVKWGFDGSSGHSQYKQRCQDQDLDDSHVFLTSMVPLKITAGSKIIWENDRPSSPRYCRPIRLQFRPEKLEVTLEENQRMQDAINRLKVRICKNNLADFITYIHSIRRTSKL